MFGGEREGSRGEDEGEGEREGPGGVRGDARRVQGEAASRRWPSVAVRVLARRGHTPFCPLAGG